MDCRSLGQAATPRPVATRGGNRTVEPKGMAIMSHSIKPMNRNEWLALRRKDITASRIATLIGEHPHHTALELWAEKTGRVPVDEIDHDAPILRRGRKLERLAFDECTDALPGRKLVHNTELEYWRDAGHRIGATPDVLVSDTERGLGVVQLKSVEPGVFKATWEGGEPP